MPDLQKFYTETLKAVLDLRKQAGFPSDYQPTAMITDAGDGWDEMLASRGDEIVKKARLHTLIHGGRVFGQNISAPLPEGARIYLLLGTL